MQMPTIAPSLTSEIQQLRDDLAIAENARVTDADRRVEELRQQLADKQAELHRQQEAESQAISVQQRARDLTALHELEQRVCVMKTELDEMRRQHGQLQMQIQRGEFVHAGLLREFVRLKQQIGV
jgi:hypothetical protein